ncbi:MAG: NYN domain-containing protein [Phycisphaerae bacterium]
MSRMHVIIDGNNLLYAMHEHAPVPHVGRETLFRAVDRWARTHQNKVTLVFDGPKPRTGLAQQMTSSRVNVQFSAPETADDVIIRKIKKASHPTTIRVVTSDSVISHAARYRRCAHTKCAAFVAELFPADRADQPQPLAAPEEKPANLSPDDVNHWLDEFGLDIEEPPFDGHDAMTDDL